MQNGKVKIQNEKAGADRGDPIPLDERVLEFAVRVGRVVDALPDSRSGRHVAGQLIRCGTSPMANYEEACAAESKADFVHKLRVCLKELRETRGWLRYIVKSRLLPARKMGYVVDEATQVCKIFGQSILTAGRGLEKRTRGMNV